MGKQGESNLNNMVMLPFGGSILLMGIRIENMMRDTYLLKEGI
jgi:hypothetical protein